MFFGTAFLATLEPLAKQVCQMTPARHSREISEPLPFEESEFHVSPCFLDLKCT